MYRDSEVAKLMIPIIISLKDRMQGDLGEISDEQYKNQAKLYQQFLLSEKTYKMTYQNALEKYQKKYERPSKEFTLYCIINNTRTRALFPPYKTELVDRQDKPYYLLVREQIYKTSTNHLFWRISNDDSIYQQLLVS